jgi:chromosomal replication initiator protein
LNGGWSPTSKRRIWKQAWRFCAPKPEKNYNIEPEILTYIAETIQSNIRELEGALNRLMVYCQLNNTRPSIEQVKSILVNVITPPKKRGVSAKKIIEVVADFYNVSPKTC